MKIAVILIVLVVLAAIALIVVGVRRASNRTRIEADRKFAETQAVLAEHRRVQAARLAAPAPKTIQSGTPVRYSGGVAKAAPSPKPKASKPSKSYDNDDTVYGYVAPDYGYADYTSYDSGSSYTDSGSSDSGYSSGGSSSSSSYDSGSSSSSSYDSGSSSSSYDSGSSSW